MYFSRLRQATVTNDERLKSIEASQAVVEFSPEGTIVSANENFLKLMGYALSEIQGKHHNFLSDTQSHQDDEFEQLWSRLSSGRVVIAEARRVGKDGRLVWLHASYSPVRDKQKRLVGVVKTAVDITAQMQMSVDRANQLSAIGRSQAVIEFDLKGTVLSANDTFLSIMRYSLHDVVGRHHSMFVEVSVRGSEDYREFWAALNRGECMSSEFKRIGRDGREVWILGSYNPIADETGRPYKVVKIATDISAEKLRNADLAAQIDAIGKSQAVIQFDMDGMVIDANENFLSALKYSLLEIKGRHHSMFVSPEEEKSESYRAFWSALRTGQYQAGEFKRIGKGGRDVWIQASYNPILDLNGRPIKVVKYATDTTKQVLARMGNERVCQMMETVAAGSEELNASVREISEAMVKSRQTAMLAVEQVEAADAQAKRFSDAAADMEGIVELIGNITGQINLLALNATIESARAGEAGRGFAVVASEVKNLANQARQATEKIGYEIGNLNGISSDVASALVEIKRAIQNVNEYVTTTAAAVEEQSTVTSEMSSSMQRAAVEAATIARG